MRTRIIREIIARSPTSAGTFIASSYMTARFYADINADVADSTIDVMIDVGTSTLKVG